MAASSSSSSPDVTQPQVFINFRGIDVRKTFADDLVHKMKAENINVFMDKDEMRGLDIEKQLMLRIEQSEIAIAIFTDTYTNSDYCLKELVKIDECAATGALFALPVFYKVKPSDVQTLEGEFGRHYRALKRTNYFSKETTDRWEKAIVSISKKMGNQLSADGDKPDREFKDEIIMEVKKVLEYIAKNPKQQRISPGALKMQQSKAGKPEKVQIPKPNINSQGGIFNVKHLKISGIDNAKYWTSLYISESSSEEAIKVAKMRNCYYLEVTGKLETKELTYGKKYEVVFVVKVEDKISEWNDPATVELMVPTKDLQEREFQFADLVKNEWVEIQVGVFVAEPHKMDISFCLYQRGSHEKKTDLQIRGAIVRPME